MEKSTKKLFYCVNGDLMITNLQWLLTFTETPKRLLFGVSVARRFWSPLVVSTNERFTALLTYVYK
jgi:hypothetical protein